ncbi:heterokaryon incompatibility protein-domain-containing protein [Paraphoma chrysanthemicola]|uniref:Heterokaryon incompatibility protein-domain-containing protein n=1 Tax=Paraphoma chrysanthemicola TaxID=798071 RepID=A0A8K0W2N6_9PLEO|nr:heterokaryon incompatibility protein-domain-containing protein [Paraphoma chrysanthemicola]
MQKRKQADFSPIEQRRPRLRQRREDSSSAGSLVVQPDHALESLGERQPFRYQELDPTKRSVRLLQVHPGQPVDEIRCSLLCFNLDTEPKYQALSYMWDHDSEKKTILCNGMSLSVGGSLWTFLLEYRKTCSQDDWLWIDAVCINQVDVRERNHQVAQMYEIYSEASSVIIWLGGANPHDRQAFQELETYHAYYNAQAPAERLKDWRILLHNYEVRGALGRWRPWNSWYYLFRKPYWRRIWIIQEVVTAKTVNIWCGDLRADADDFKRAGDGANGVHEIRDTPGWRLLQLRSSWQTRHEESPPSTFSLRSLSTSFATSDSTDPRDFVYALLGIAVDASGQSHCLVADYSKSAAEVVADVARIVFHLQMPELKGYQDSFGGSAIQEVEDFVWTSEKMESNFIYHLMSKLGVHGQDGDEVMHCMYRARAERILPLARVQSE